MEWNPGVVRHTQYHTRESMESSSGRRKPQKWVAGMLENILEIAAKVYAEEVSKDPTEDGKRRAAVKEVDTVTKAWTKVRGAAARRGARHGYTDSAFKEMEKELAEMVKEVNRLKEEFAKAIGKKAPQLIKYVVGDIEKDAALKLNKGKNPKPGPLSKMEQKLAVLAQLQMPTGASDGIQVVHSPSNGGMPTDTPDNSRTDTPVYHDMSTPPGSPGNVTPAPTSPPLFPTSPNFAGCASSWPHLGYEFPLVSEVRHLCQTNATLITEGQNIRDQLRLGAQIINEKTAEIQKLEKSVEELKKMLDDFKQWINPETVKKMALVEHDANGLGIDIGTFEPVPPNGMVIAGLTVGGVFTSATVISDATLTNFMLSNAESDRVRYTNGMMLEFNHVVNDQAAVYVVNQYRSSVNSMAANNEAFYNAWICMGANEEDKNKRKKAIEAWRDDGNSSHPYHA